MVPWDLTLTACGQLCRKWRAFCNVGTVIVCRIWPFEQHMGHRLDFYPLVLASRYSELLRIRLRAISDSWNLVVRMFGQKGKVGMEARQR
jgi:hypothetical protein